MDQASFDRLARLLGGEATRRAGLKAALAGLLGLAALDPLDATPTTVARERSDRRRSADRNAGQRAGGPSVAGPCGPSRAANVCRRNADCCTGLCNARRRGRNTDQLGRCRCVDRGRACSEDRNCCGGLRCYGGKCLAAPPRPSGCASAADCPTPPSCNTTSCIDGLCRLVADANDASCPGGQCKDGACVPCTTDDACSANPKKKVCDSSSNTCVQCTADANCSTESTRKTCDTDTSTCVQCTADANCSGESLKKVCNTDTNACVQCTADANCSAESTRKICDTSANTCVQCTADANCSTESVNKVCKTDISACVQCVNDADCDSSTPVCAATNVCKACATPSASNLVTGSPLHTPAGIVTDPNSSTHQVWVSNFAYQSAASNAKLGYMKFDGTGLTMGTSVSKGIQGIALSSDKTPFGCANDSGAGNVYRFDPSTANPVTPPVCTSSDTNFKSAYGIYVDGDSSTGTVWVISAASSADVWKFKIGTDAAPVKVFTSLGSTGRGITMGPGGWLYACIEGSNKIAVLDPATAASGSLPSSSTVAVLNVTKPFAIAFSGDTMYVNNAGDSKLYRYRVSLDGSNVPSISLLCQYTYSSGLTFFIALDPDGNILSPFWGASRPQDGVLKLEF